MRALSRKLMRDVWHSRSQGLAIGLVIFCSVTFVGGLKLPIPLCPSIEMFEQFKLCRF